jgi:hypothetical protein
MSSTHEGEEDTPVMTLPLKRGSTTATADASNKRICTEVGVEVELKGEGVGDNDDADSSPSEHYMTDEEILEVYNKHKEWTMIQVTKRDSVLWFVPSARVDATILKRFKLRKFILLLSWLDTLEEEGDAVCFPYDDTLPTEKRTYETCWVFPTKIVKSYIIPDEDGIDEETLYTGDDKIDEELAEEEEEEDEDEEEEDEEEEEEDETSDEEKSPCAPEEGCSAVMTV